MPQALIVEDEPEVNELLSMLIQTRGYRTISAFTGGEALELARGHRPDVVFLDLMLPDISGYEVCRALGGERATGDIPVVMVTARVAEEGRIEGFRAGVADYVAKPYTPRQIFDALDQAGAWRRGLDADPPAGSIALRVEDEADHLFALGQLRGRMLARTALAESRVREVAGTLGEVAARAVLWGRGQAGAGDRVATLDYRCDPAGVALTLRDDSGWFADDPPGPGGPADGLGAILARGGLGPDDAAGVRLRATADADARRAAP